MSSIDFFRQKNVPRSQVGSVCEIIITSKSKAHGTRRDTWVLFFSAVAARGTIKIVKSFLISPLGPVKISGAVQIVVGSSIEVNADRGQTK